MKKLEEWKEKDLYGHLQKYYYPDLKPRMKLSSHDDCYSIDADAVIELKCRTKHFDDGMMIEKEKYDWMMDISAASRLRNCYYINSTPEGIYRWDLYKMGIPMWKTRDHNKQTDGVPVFQREKVPKLVADLQFNDAVIMDNKESLTIKHYESTIGEVPIEIRQKLDRQAELRRIAREKNKS